MPESKHRRKGKRRPRPSETKPPPHRPDPSPTWVPATGAALLGAGVLVIFLGYLRPVQDFTASWPWFSSNWNLVLGFVALSTGFGFLTQWR